MPIDAATLTEYKKLAGNIVVLLELQLSGGTLRFTGAEVPVWLDGNEYAPLAMSAEPTSAGLGSAVEDVRISIDNVSAVAAAAFLSGSQQGRVAVISTAMLDEATKVVASVEAFRGVIASYELDDATATITITHEMAYLWRKTPQRKHDYELCPNLADLEEKEIWWGSVKKGS